jgi:Skp family chaperone for outer membrane proteins
MKSTIIRLACLFAVAAFCTAATAAQAPKIATVDLKKLFDGYWKTKQANTKLKDFTADMERESNAIKEKYKKLDEEYKKLLEGANDQTVSAEEREKRKKGAEDKLLEIRQVEVAMEQFVRNARANLGEQERRMRDNIVKELRDTIAVKAKAGAFTLVLDTSGETSNTAPTVMFNSGDADLTDAVLADLNAKAPPEAAKPAEAKPAETKPAAGVK